MNFRGAFRALTGSEPFPWQEALYERFLADRFPEVCNLPTGLGKTAVIPIWLIALAEQPGHVPRRLVYVVNRRTVVDQASDEARKVRERLPDELARKLRVRRDDRSAEPLVAISTLRGQFADNREWSADPSRPAVIVGTVDMIGSRLLFSGYRVGFKSKPLHAGFLGQDALLVHDEAHLEPAFQQLILSIKREQEPCRDREEERCRDFRPLRVMELSATSRESDGVFTISEKDKATSRESDGVFTISEKDKANPEVRKRITARKTIHLHAIEDEKKIAEDLIALALQHKESCANVLVFARSLDTVNKVEERLGKERPTRTLTGTMRGKERDELVETPVFRRFLPDAEQCAETAYLVCTSAGEVGVNISADHLVCDLSTFESMAQRFGRVNRFGKCDETRIDIVHPREFDEKDTREDRRRKTLILLKQLNGNASPEALDELDPHARRAAFSPNPVILPTSDILFDAWSLTTIRDKLPGRPPVAPYLHGLVENESPETHVAWREEVGCITGDLLDRYEPKDLLEVYPLKPHELLRDRSDRVFKALETLAAARPKDPIWIIDLDGSVKVMRFEEVAKKEGKDQINNRTVLLSPAAGGLNGGLLTPRSEDKVDVMDVADEWRNERNEQIRKRLWDDGDAQSGMRLVRVIDTRPAADETEEGDSNQSLKRFWYWYVRDGSVDDDGSRNAEWAVHGDDHTCDVVKHAKEITGSLPLPDDMKRALIIAARCHDLGKRRITWQRSIGNTTPGVWFAKSGKGKDQDGTPMRPRGDASSYRHEFGSLLDAYDVPEFQDLGPHEQDLVLHLIAAHHGRGRPHFPTEEAFDPEPRGKDVDAVAAEVPRRFARLQRKYGRWGLAYVESLLRAADYAASAHPSLPKREKP